MNTWCFLTCDGSAHLPRRLLSGLNGGLFTVPGCVWGTDKIWGVLQWALRETGKENGVSVMLGEKNKNNKGGFTGKSLNMDYKIMRL